MAKMIADYRDAGLVSLKHTENNAVLETDVPAALGGSGQRFCPGDMLVGALAGCALLTMGEMAKSRNKSIDGTKIEVDYEMASRPDRIAKIQMNVAFSDTVAAEDRKKYLAALKACPVHNSLNKDIVLEVVSN